MSLLMQRWKKSPALADTATQTTLKDRPLRLADKNAPISNTQSNDTTLPTPMEMAEMYYKEGGLSDKSFDTKDIERANEINEKMHKLGISRYAVCSPRGGLSFRAIRPSCINKPNVGYVSPKDVSHYLEKHYGFNLKEMEDKSVTSLKQMISTFVPKKGTRAPVETKTDVSVQLPKVENEVKSNEETVTKSVKAKSKREKVSQKVEVDTNTAADVKEADDLEKNLDDLTKMMHSALVQ